MGLVDLGYKGLEFSITFSSNAAGHLWIA